MHCARRGSCWIQIFSSFYGYTNLFNIDWVLEPVNNFCKAGHQEYTQMKKFDSWQTWTRALNWQIAIMPKWTFSYHSAKQPLNPVHWGSLSAGHPDWELFYLTHIHENQAWHPGCVSGSIGHYVMLPKYIEKNKANLHNWSRSVIYILKIVVWLQETTQNPPLRRVAWFSCMWVK